MPLAQGCKVISTINILIRAIIVFNSLINYWLRLTELLMNINNWLKTSHYLDTVLLWVPHVKHLRIQLPLMFLVLTLLAYLSLLGVAWFWGLLDFCGGGGDIGQVLLGRHCFGFLFEGLTHFYKIWNAGNYVCYRFQIVVASRVGLVLWTKLGFSASYELGSGWMFLFIAW